MLPILEYVCEVHLRAMASGAPIALLSDAQMDDALKGLANYGKQPARGK